MAALDGDQIDESGISKTILRFHIVKENSNKLRHVLSIEQAKTAETRQRRIEKAISMLRKAKNSVI